MKKTILSVWHEGMKHLLPRLKQVVSHSVWGTSLVLAMSHPIQAQTFSLLKDINPNLLTMNSAQQEKVTVGNTTYIITVIQNVRQLWVYNHLTGETTAIRSFSINSTDTYTASITAFNGNAYFYAMSNVSAKKALWKTDGTSAGTVMVKDLNLVGPNNPIPNGMTVCNGALYFNAYDASSGVELWKTTDGINSSLVKDINPGVGNSSITSLTAVGNLLYFGANNGSTGVELWKTDGTSAGTVLVRDINFGTTGSNIVNITAVGTTVFFVANNGLSGAELWKSDGTATGTLLVKDIMQGSTGSNPAQLSNINNILFFSASNATTGQELWKSNGTSAGTVLVKDIRPGTNSSALKSIVNFNGKAYFVANNATFNTEVWESDGTAAGTKVLKEIAPDTVGSEPVQLTVHNSKLYFFTSSYNSNFPNPFGIFFLWKSDGTSQGTLPIADFGNMLEYFTEGFGLASANNDLLFFSRKRLPQTSGLLLNKVDGTSNTLSLAKALSKATLSANPSQMIDINGTLYFVADNGTNGSELWKTTGTLASTTMVKDIYAGSSGSFISSLTNVNGTLYFCAYDPTYKYGIWKSNGTTNGTVLVRGAFESNPGNLTNLNGTLYFTANDGGRGVELWKSNGSAANTVLVRDIRGGSASSNPSSLIAFNNTLYFIATDDYVGQELWKSDGTSNGTAWVKDIYAGAGSGVTGKLVVSGNQFYFTGTTANQGKELWKYDGFIASLVKDLTTGSTSSAIDSYNFRNINGTLFFFTGTQGSGGQLWKTTGTSATTLMLYSGLPNFSTPAVANNHLYFSSNNSLWRSDGSDIGTAAVTPLDLPSGPNGQPGTADMSPVTIDYYLYFKKKTNGVIDYWRTDGTDEGTVLAIPNVAPMENLGYTMVKSGSKIYMAASHNAYSQELWVAEAPLPSARKQNNALVATEAEEQENLQLYPNPCKDRCSLQIPDAEIVTVEIYGMDGIAYQNTYTSGNLYLESLPSGLYKVIVQTSQGKKVSKTLVKE